MGGILKISNYTAMKQLIRYSGIIFISIIAFIGFQYCTKDQILPAEKELELQAAGAVHGLMADWYLWYDSMPIVNKNDYSTPEDMMSAMRYLPRDIWSYVSTLEEYKSYFEEGTYEGHGFSYRGDEEGNYWILFVYKNSDFYSQGVRRGWRILKVNGTTIPALVNLSDYMSETTDVFLFLKPDGTIVEITSTRKLININSVLHADTLHIDGKIVGHIVFNSFIEPAIAELDSIFGSFKDMGVQELILDMRYNRGGRMDVAQKLASLIAGSANSDEVFVKYMYNDKQEYNNSDVLLESEINSLSLSELIVLTSGSTASASEAIINGLKPYMTVTTIGSPTYGKPVGMNVWSYADYYVFVPVTFRLVNSLGEGDYYAGLPVDSNIDDGLEWEFSDRNEIYLKEAIHYLSTGTFTGTSIPLKSYIPLHPQKYGLKWEIGAE